MKKKNFVSRSILGYCIVTANRKRKNIYLLDKIQGKKLLTKKFIEKSRDQMTLVFICQSDILNVKKSDNSKISQIVIDISATPFMQGRAQN